MDTLWNIIRDFFVRYVFGGFASDGSVYADRNSVGMGLSFENMNYSPTYTSWFYVPIKGFDGDTEQIIDYITLGDWLSTTATIITLIALFIGITMLTIKLFKFVSNAISMR